MGYQIGSNFFGSSDIITGNLAESPRFQSLG